MFSDTDKNDKLSLHELPTMYQLVYEIFKNYLTEEKMVEDKVLKIISRESVQDSFTRFWFLFADSDENDELSLEEISSAKDIFVEDEGITMKDMVAYIVFMVIWI